MPATPVTTPSGIPLPANDNTADVPAYVGGIFAPPGGEPGLDDQVVPTFSDYTTLQAAYPNVAANPRLNGPALARVVSGSSEPVYYRWNVAAAKWTVPPGTPLGLFNSPVGSAIDTQATADGQILGLTTAVTIPAQASGYDCTISFAGVLAFTAAGVGQIELEVNGSVVAVVRIVASGSTGGISGGGSYPLDPVAPNTATSFRLRFSKQGSGGNVFSVPSNNLLTYCRAVATAR